MPSELLRGAAQLSAGAILVLLWGLPQHALNSLAANAAQAASARGDTPSASTTPADVPPQAPPKKRLAFSAAPPDVAYPRATTVRAAAAQADVGDANSGPVPGAALVLRSVDAFADAGAAGRCALRADSEVAACSVARLVRALRCPLGPPAEI